MADTRYSTARSVSPVQVPDDLSPPNENDALRLPPDLGAAGSSAAGACLESPPSFFGDSQPFRRSADADESEQTSEQNDAERAPPAPAAGDGDRVIDN